MSNDLLYAAIKEPVYALGATSPLTPELITRCVDLVRSVARWNRNTTSENHVLCITEDREIAEKYLSDGQRERAEKSTDGWQTHGTTWSRWVEKPLDGQIIWLNPEKHENVLSYVDTFAHELSHAFTRTTHGWTWRRMYVMITPMIMQIVIPNEAHYTTSQLARRVVREYRRRSVSGARVSDIDPRWQLAVFNESQAHIRAADRCHPRFSHYL